MEKENIGEIFHPHTRRTAPHTSEVKLQNGTPYGLTQGQMAELFETTKQNISLPSIMLSRSIDYPRVVVKEFFDSHSTRSLERKKRSIKKLRFINWTSSSPSDIAETSMPASIFAEIGILSPKNPIFTPWFFSCICHLPVDQINGYQFCLRVSLVSTRNL